MAEFDLEYFIKELPAELQDKAKACKNMTELNEFVAENDIELPEEALDMVAGGGALCGTGDRSEDESPSGNESSPESSGCPKGGAHKWVKKGYCKECEKCGATRYNTL